MSVRSGKVCKDCNHCIRERDNTNVVVRRCEVHHMYLSYETVIGGICKHWEKPKKNGGRVMKCRECTFMSDFGDGLYRCTNHDSIHYMEYTGVCCEDECDDGEYLVPPEQEES